MRSLVKDGPPPDLLAYADGQPAGWCAVEPRERYVRLASSRVLKPVDDQLVWSVACFFVAHRYRRRGVIVELLKAAADFARRRGARIIEGYPSEPKTRTARRFCLHGTCVGLSPSRLQRGGPAFTHSANLPACVGPGAQPEPGLIKAAPRPGSNGSSPRIECQGWNLLHDEQQPHLHGTRRWK